MYQVEYNNPDSTTDALAQRNAEEEALVPFWDELWGKLDANSLRTDFFEARQELARRHGIGLFAKKGEGLAVDELADELKNRGLLEEDADSSTLIERLKDMQRPDRRRVRWRREMFQTGSANSFGVPLNRVTVFDKSFSRKEMEAALQQLAGRDLLNLIEGGTAQVNLTQRKKLKSAKAIDKSIANGFGGGVHLSFAAKIENLWRWAARATPDAEAEIQRFVSAIRVGDEDVFAWLTIKNNAEGLRIYSIELMDQKKLGETSRTVTTDKPKDAPFRAFDDIMAKLSAPVKVLIPIIRHYRRARVLMKRLPPVRLQWNGSSPNRQMYWTPCSGRMWGVSAFTGGHREKGRS